MGVTGLWKLIEQSGKPVPLDTLENKVLAVDISIWLHQVLKGFQDSNGATLPNAHLLGLFHRLCKLLYYRIRPVFVFDGGVPPLKRETIAKRARNKNKYQSEADKLQQLLLESLAKEKVVQQALGQSTSALLTNSPQKLNAKKPKDDDDLFKLPPIQENVDDNNETDESMTDLSEGDSSTYDSKSRVIYNQNLSLIDVTSSYFQSLPPDIRHEILSDIKETRKQSSWGRLHELPVESRSFSTFQMERLLKRRQVQVELEGAEKELGGKGLSLAELENLLSEKGVVDPDVATNRIASNEHTRYLHVRDVKKAMDNEAKAVKREKSSPLKKVSKMELIQLDEHIASEEDLALQKAIHLSLGVCNDEAEESATGEYDGMANSSPESIKMTVEQRKALGAAATSLARNYMIEYGGLNDDQIGDLVKLDETIKPASEFKFNDDSILTDKNDKKIAECKSIDTVVIETKENTIEISDTSSDEGVSSDADSDFIDVPEIDNEEKINFLEKSKIPLPAPFLMNEPPLPDQSKDFSLNDLQMNSVKFEVIINPFECHENKNDLFSDIFVSTENLKETLTPLEMLPNNKNDEKVEVDDTTLLEKKSFLKPIKAMNSILSDLDKEMTNVTKINLNDLLKSDAKMEGIKISAITEEKVTAEIAEKLQVLQDGKLIDANEPPSTPPKIPQPFFVKKTPPSSKKKNQSQADKDNSTPIKASKSLLESFETLAVPSTPTDPINEKQIFEMAANVLRENKSENELQEIADQLYHEKQDLVAERNKKDRMGVSITEQMSIECMELLRLFGIPYIVAPMEAEAQCAFLNEIELTDGTITDDSDIWLFGGKTVYKNFFDQNKLVMEFQSNNIKNLFHIDRREMIQLSILVGSDYTQGIHGIGTVTALEVLSLFSATAEKEGETSAIMSTLSSLRKFRDWWELNTVTHKTVALRKKLKNISLTEGFPSARVVEAYLFPTVDENNQKFTWGHPELESIREYAKKSFGWTNRKTDEIILPVMKKLNEKTSQQSIRNYFKITATETRTDLKVSNRVRKALDQMSSEMNVDDGVEIIEKKKPKRKPVKVMHGDANNKLPKRTTKNGRKKKITISELEAFVDNDVSEQASTSTAPAMVAEKERKINLPQTEYPIPQREKDKQIMESNKLKAIELLKKKKQMKK